MEKCIMPKSDLYSIERLPNLERHEIFHGKNRKHSIEDGLVVFLTPEQHRGNNSVHLSPNDWNWLKELAETVWIEYYNKDENEFRKRYGKNYIIDNN